MTGTLRFPIVPLGLSFGSFFVTTYALCVLYGLVVTHTGMHQLLPGFTSITWPSFLLGLIWGFLCGWYVAVVFRPIFNFFSERAS